MPKANLNFINFWKLSENATHREDVQRMNMILEDVQRMYPSYGLH
jgi:phosphopentomutase